MKSSILRRAFLLALDPAATTAAVLARLRREREEPEPQWEAARDDHGREIVGCRTRVMTAEEIEADRADRAERRAARHCPVVAAPTALDSAALVTRLRARGPAFSREEILALRALRYDRYVLTPWWRARRNQALREAACMEAEVT